MSRRMMPFLSLAMVGALSLAAIVVSVRTDKAAHVETIYLRTHPNQPDNPYGAPGYGFGGYSLQQSTTEIGAQWRVPAINPQSSDGNATTWIGVQNDVRQFIQLGTFENKGPFGARYEIFWSDVTEGFHPVQLLEVKAGDLISFSMTQTDRGWRLHFDDLTQKVPETITIPYAIGSVFLSAQWIQEDPTTGGLSNHLPYPSIAAPVFSHLTLNERVPPLHFADAQVLSTVGGVDLVPTPEDHGGFTFTNAVGPAHQYLRDVFGFNVAIYPFQVDQFYGRSPTVTVLRQIRATLAALKSKLTTQTWPAALSSAVHADVGLVDSYAHVFKTFTVAPDALGGAEMTQLENVDRLSMHASDRLRADLGLPPIN